MSERWSLEKYRAFLAQGEALPASPSAPAAARRGTASPSEHDEQVRFFAAIELLAQSHPDRADELEDVYATSSGGKRPRGAGGQLREAGQRRGIPDIEVWVPRPPHHGMVIELKRVLGGRASREQVARIDRLKARGYRADIVHGWVPALQLLCDYLGLPMPAAVEDKVEFHLLQRAARRKAARIAQRTTRNRTTNCA